MTPHVHPTRDDPVVRALSPVVGGPMGEHGDRARWWTPLAVLMALTTVALLLGMVHQLPCQRDGWSSADRDRQHAQLCASRIATTYTDAGLAELVWPLDHEEQVRRRHQPAGLPVLTAAWAWGAAHLTHTLTGSPDVLARAQRPVPEVRASPAVRHELDVFMALNAIGMALLALLTTWWLVRAAGRRRPWAAATFAASPLLALTWLTDWMLLPVAALAGGLLAWLTGHRVLAAVLGVVVLLAWLPVAALDRPDVGSVWLLAQQVADTAWSGAAVLVPSAVLLVTWCLAVAVLARRTHAGAGQVVLLVLVGVLLVAPQAPPAWSLILLPAAALAVPRWRDLVVWQAAELVALLLTGLYLGGQLAPAGGGDATAYWLAIALRVAGQLWLAGAVVADLSPPGPRRTASR